MSEAAVPTGSSGWKWTKIVINVIAVALVIAAVVALALVQHVDISWWGYA